MGLATKIRQLLTGHDTEFVGQASNQANSLVLLGKTLAESAQHVSEHANEQVSYTSEAVQAMDQMSTSIREVVESTSSTSDAATQMAELNNLGLRNMEQLNQSVHEVHRLYEHLDTALKRLNETSEKVNKVVEIINSVAEQTNLLSINARIEAAHVGARGRGFAVVAQEIRELSDQTKQSTREITDAIAENKRVADELSTTIKKSMNAVKTSVDQSESTTEGMRTVAREIETVREMVQKIAAATEQQSGNAEQVSQYIDGVVRLAQDTRTDADNSFKTGNDLSRLAAGLEKRFDSDEVDYFGVVPLENAIKMNHSFYPLCQFIGRVLEREFYIRLGHDYADAISDIGSGHALISYQTPSTYIEAREKYGIEPLAVPLAKGEPYYQSAIVVREDSGITDIQQLAGLRFAFGDPKSTGSKAMPEFMLKQQHVGLNDLAEYDFLGSHDNVAKAVLAGKFDGGGLMMSVAEKFVSKGLKILAISDKIPQFPICVSNRLSISDREKLLEALINLDDPEILGRLGSHVTGFAPIQDSDYDSVRVMLKNL